MERRVIGITAFSGGGKTALTKKLVERLGDALAVHYDDYGDSIQEPPVEKWAEASYDEWKAPILARDLKMLKQGKSIIHPISKQKVVPKKYVIYDGLGKAHRETGQYIDLMFYVDTPLDIAMARRILRNYAAPESEKQSDAEVRRELELYLRGARNAYLNMDRQCKPMADYVLDGTLSLEDLTSLALAKINEFFKSWTT